ncbi:hypothetical protein GGS24DRAFT_478248 [Hypoxylon argillaceum]|nr:hypothetical protein GGS24DRAFT_478248 [Hypoxylon argillaceum]
MYPHSPQGFLSRFFLPSRNQLYRVILRVYLSTSLLLTQVVYLWLFAESDVLVIPGHYNFFWLHLALVIGPTHTLPYTMLRL